MDEILVEMQKQMKSLYLSEKLCEINGDKKGADKYFNKRQGMIQAKSIIEGGKKETTSKPL